MTITQRDVQENYRRARALPIYARGEIPDDKNLTVKDDSSGFLDVLRLFLRSWPYIRPQLLGRWYVPGKGIEDRVADTFVAEGYTFAYAPILFILVGLLGPLVGFVQGPENFAIVLMYVSVAVTGTAFLIMCFGPRDIFMYSALGVIFGNITTILLSFYVIDGYADGAYTVVLLLISITGWMFQIKIQNGRIDYRVRLHAHLVYFYGIQFTQRFMGLAFALVNADLLNQAILQGEPLAEGLARILGYDELNVNNIAELSTEERYEIMWFWIKFNVSFHLISFLDQHIQWLVQHVDSTEDQSGSSCCIS